MKARHTGNSSWKGVASTLHTSGLLLALVAVSIWGAFRNPLTEWPKTLYPVAQAVISNVRYAQK